MSVVPISDMYSNGYEASAHVFLPNAVGAGPCPMMNGFPGPGQPPAMMDPQMGAIVPHMFFSPQEGRFFPNALPGFEFSTPCTFAYVPNFGPRYGPNYNDRSLNGSFDSFYPPIGAPVPLMQILGPERSPPPPPQIENLHQDFQGSPIDILMGLYPNKKRIILELVLKRCDNDLDKAVEELQPARSTGINEFPSLLPYPPATTSALSSYYARSRDAVKDQITYYLDNKTGFIVEKRPEGLPAYRELFEYMMTFPPELMSPMPQFPEIELPPPILCPDPFCEICERVRVDRNFYNDK